MYWLGRNLMESAGLTIQVTPKRLAEVPGHGFHAEVACPSVSSYAMNKLKNFSRYLLGLLFTAAGINHFWHTSFYLAMMPPWLPLHLELVYLSGVAEIALGVLLFFSRWQALAAWGLIALCIAVFPANVHMALHPELYAQFTPTGLWLRLPLQAVAIAWAWCYTLRPTTGSAQP